MPKPCSLTDNEAAAYLGVSTAYLRKSRTRNYSGPAAPPFVKIGKSVRYRVSDLDAFLDAHLVTVSGDGS